MRPLGVTHPVPADHPAGHLDVELRALRRGLGLYDARLPQRVGGLARRVFEVAPSDVVTTVRAKVIDALDRAMVRFPSYQRAVLGAAFNLGAVDATYRRRMEEFAAVRGVVERTARRWADRGVAALAGALHDPTAPRPRAAWWTDHLSRTLVLDRPRAQLLEARRIVAVAEVSELRLSLAVPGCSAADLAERAAFQVFHGGALRIGAPESSTRLGLVLTLPRTLRAGEFHEYALLVRLPAHHVPASYFVHVPRHPCAALDLRVRFPPGAAPGGVTVLADVLHHEVEDPLVVGPGADVDSVGDLRVGFDHPTPGFASGVRWGGASR
ncbi:hypothetical protein [Actinosynnema sp. NPDC020468]|uniref:hypothetical protein n=1 Tax=Actinosynnema sp. NPDC020468 TaxID=3154488 RepID=UPI0033EE94AF